MRQQNNQSARRRSDDAGKLKRAAVERYGAGKLVSRDQTRHKGRARRPKKCPRHANDDEQKINPDDIEQNADTSVNPRLATDSTSVAAKIIFFRLNRSAKCPAGSVHKIIGIINDRPTNASESAECVRW